MNELNNETSPYLLQHAPNPVHWKAWRPESLATAVTENKLMIISIGYSACHWCHVMEHQTFEDNDAADVMNANFISVKVDREERPDVDAVYMKAVQLMGGHGGWPLNIVTLPDGRPVWGGTYFPKQQWIDYLEQLAKMYSQDPAKLVEYAERLQQGIESISVIQRKNNDTELSQDLLKPLVDKWKKSFDHEFGGMARAPKFMMPNNLRFMQRYAVENNDTELSDFVNLTLTKMAYGGLFDTLGGGFSRYSVDMKWHVPHFEKMLYDNGQLLSVYADAYKVTKNPLYKEVIEKTLKFINTDFANGEGGFYSALDADSLDQNDHLEEGAFYVWTQPQLRELLGSDFDLFAAVFSVDDFGHWENGNYVLIQKQSLETIASEHGVSVQELQSRKIQWEKLLFDNRELRPKPRLDDKCLVSWNAIACKGFVDAYKALGTEYYLTIAKNNANFLLQKCISADGALFHTYKNGKATVNGYLEDYTWLTNALIAVYEVTFDEKWLNEAKRLTDYCFAHFYDDVSGFFAFTSDIDPALIARHFETEDNVIAASNSVMAENLYKLAIYFADTNYDETIENMLKHILRDIKYPSAYANWLYVFMNYGESNKELAICAADAEQYAKTLAGLYVPHIVVAGSKSDSELPFLEQRFETGKSLFYVCKNKTCEMPVTSFQQVLKSL